MKKFILIIIICLFSIAGFSENPKNNSSAWNSSFQQDDLETQFKIYPNPYKQGKLTVEFNVQEIEELRIINIAGKEVLVKKFQIPENKKQIELTDISNGIYLLRVKTTDDKSVVKKLVVARD